MWTSAAWQTREQADDKVFTGPYYVSSSAAVFGRDGAQLVGASTRSIPFDAYGFRVDAWNPRVRWIGDDVFFAWSDKRVRQRVDGQVRQQAGIYGRRLAPRTKTSSGDEMLVDYAHSTTPFHIDANATRLVGAWIAGGKELEPFLSELPSRDALPVPELRLMDAKDVMIAPDGVVYALFGEAYVEGSLRLVRKAPGAAPVVSDVPISSGIANRVTVAAESAGGSVWIAWATDDSGAEYQDVGWSRIDDTTTHASIRVGPQANLRVKILDLQIVDGQLSVLVSHVRADQRTVVELHQRCLR